MKKEIGSVLALYPTPVVVAGTIIDEKPNWILVAHVGIIGHDRILLSCAKQHYTNQGIRKTGIVSVNLVNEAMLPKADYVGCVSGSTTDKSKVFAYQMGSHGAPLIEESPLVMECSAEDIYDARNFDNFVLKIHSTYADPSVLGESGKVDYTKLSPVLFDMPNYQYHRIGEVIGDCRKINHGGI